MQTFLRASLPLDNPGDGLVLKKVALHVDQRHVAGLGIYFREVIDAVFVALTALLVVNDADVSVPFKAVNFFVDAPRALPLLRRLSAIRRQGAVQECRV